MTVPFNQLTDTVRIPFAYTEFDPTHASSDLSLMPFSVLLTGQMLESGKASPLSLCRPTSPAQGKDMFGPGSMLADMVEAYLTANPQTKMLALPVADYDEGNAATGAIQLDGTVTSATPLCIYIGGKLVRVGTLAGSTAADLATKVKNAINADANLPVVASSNSTAVEVTAKHKGECGNYIDLRVSYKGEAIPGGLAVTFTAMSGGAGNPDAMELLAALTENQYHVIAWPWLDNASMDILREEMDNRWGPITQNDGQAIVVKTGSFVDVCNFATRLNNRGITVIANEGSPTLPWADAAACVGVVAFYGNQDPARGFNSLKVPGVLAPFERDLWTKFPEKNQGLFEGVSARYVNASGDVCLSSLITTYRVNALGAEDKAYLSLNSPMTLSYLRYDWNNYLMLKYPRHKLASDIDAARFKEGQPIMYPKLGKAEAVTRFGYWMEAGLVQGSAQFEKSMIVEINSRNSNRLDWHMMPHLVGQFEVAGTLMSHLLGGIS